MNSAKEDFLDAHNRRMTDFTPPPSSSMARGQLSARATSPLPSGGSLFVPERTPQEPPISAKRSLFDKIRGKDKGKSSQDPPPRSIPTAKNSLQSSTGSVFKLDPQPPKRHRDPSVITSDSSQTARPSDFGLEPGKKESKSSKLLHGHGKFATQNKSRFSHDSDKSKANDIKHNESYWNLDTDLNNMEGIVSAVPLETPTTAGVLLSGTWQGDDGRKEPWETAPTTGPGAWDAPDSWAVKKIGDENMARLREIDEEGIAPKSEDTGVMHGIRVFRIDSTFTTLLTGVNTTASEILQQIGKKSFLQDDLDTYQIVMRKNDLQRQLAPGERPVAIQRRLLEQAGYEASDHIDEVGLEDNSYLCRFTFVPTKISGYFTLERDSGLDKMVKFSHVDLSGRSLVTIPIILYKKASEIISLNLSRNLALDVPKDFVQSCIHLREIKFTGNEAWQLPASLSLASRLTVLDISNNRLEQLEHANLEELKSLVSIKISNNKLTTLPKHFAQLQHLRSLNLSSNYLRVFPDYLCDLPSIVDLDISFNTIEALPKIGQLKTLERLWATNNSLRGSFPDGFRELTNLKEIDVRFNKIANMDVMSQLPKLEQLMIGHNSVSRFEGSFDQLRILHADHNPITRFDIKGPMPSLTSLNLASASLSHLDDSLYERISSLTKLNLNKNHFTTLSNQIGRLARLEYLSLAKNALITLPPTIGCLQELRYLDMHECNIKTLPSELWLCYRLNTLNISSNVLELFPKLSSSLQMPNLDSASSYSTLSQTASNSQVPPSPVSEDSNRFDEGRRPSQSSGGLLGIGSSPVNSTRKGSIVSVYGPGGRKASVISRTPTGDGNLPLTRKDSNISSRLTSTFAGSLQHLFLADNRLAADVFEMICLLPELRVLNLSYNELDDVPQNIFRRWPHLHHLYLSGNDISTLPREDFDMMENHPLKGLYLNGNKFQVLPAELGKVKKMDVLDIGSNALKYNVSNWRYDWNWNFNKNLKYLNFSGNKRLEIKPSPNTSGISGIADDGQDLTNFTLLQHLRVLGLMDVTLTIPNVPEETDDRRVRTSGTAMGGMTYGMADCLGRNEHLSTIDLLIPRFRSNDLESLLGLFDGQSMSSGGSKIAKFLHENFGAKFAEELGNVKALETPCDALRRTFLDLNKQLAMAATQTLDKEDKRIPQMSHRSSITQVLNAEDVQSGGVATVLYLDNMELYVANVGDAQAMLVHSSSEFEMLTEEHKPATTAERQRIREAGGYVSRHGKLNDALEVSRAFGYIQHMPAVMASPFIQQITLTEADEMVLIASKELWDYITPDVVVDVARSERGDVMRAAQKLRDLAISYGSLGKIMVMLVNVADLKRRDRSRNRGNTLSMGPSQMMDDPIYSKRGKRGRDAPDDSTLARLDKEVDAPTRELTLVFTDIKSSTALWESFPIAMRSGIKIHNDLLRRQLRIIGGYEVKTEGDAFMVAFPTATSALCWAFSVQQALLKAPWPTEILNSIHGQEILDLDGNCIYRGLSVRMGMHWGSPVWEPDLVTRRMDYFGPMVNRASRISSVADGGQITVSHDFISEIERILEVYAESDRSGSVGSEDTMTDDPTAQRIRADLRSLTMQGFEVKDLGERRLKGLENPENIYLMYPYILSARLSARVNRGDQPQPTSAAAAALDGPSAAAATLARDSQLDINAQIVWDLWRTGLRLEMLCSTLETRGHTALVAPEMGILEKMRSAGGEITDSLMVHFVEHLITRVEVSPSRPSPPPLHIFAIALELWLTARFLDLRGHAGAAPSRAALRREEEPARAGGAHERDHARVVERARRAAHLPRGGGHGYDGSGIRMVVADVLTLSRLYFCGLTA